MSKYKYTMKMNEKLLLDLIENAIGRRPDEHGRSGVHMFSFTFQDTDISPADRTTARAALPPWMKQLYGFTREVLPDDEI